jgi:hypothetical protein
MYRPRAHDGGTRRGVGIASFYAAAAAYFVLINRVFCRYEEAKAARTWRLEGGGVFAGRFMSVHAGEIPIDAVANQLTAVREVPSLAAVRDRESDRIWTDTDRRNHFLRSRLRQHARRSSEQRKLHFDRELRQIRRCGPQSGGGLLGVHMPRVARSRVGPIVGARAACFSRDAGSGCSYELLVILIRFSTQSRAI